MTTRRETKSVDDVDVMRRQTSTSQRSTRRQLLVGLALAGLACSPGKGTTAYIGATVWDGTGGAPLQDAVILVSGGHIEALGPAGAVKIPRGTQQVHLDGRFVIPGLIDGHVHATRWSLSRYVAYGVTAARDMGGPEDSILALREAANLGSVVSPRLYISGAMIDGPPGLAPWVHVVHNGDEARRAIDSLILLNVHQAKIHSQITPRLLEPLMDEANAFKLPVAAHLGKVDALTAVRLGVNSLEHSSGVAAASMANPPALFDAYDDFRRGFKFEARIWPSLDSAALDRTARALAETGVTVVPTLALVDGLAHAYDSASLAAQDRSGMPHDRSLEPVTMAKNFGLTSADVAALAATVPQMELFLRRFQHYGGLLVAGSDSPIAVLPPGWAIHREMAMLVSAGFTPEQALSAATRNAAQLLRTDSIGTLARGAVADFLILRGNPLQDISHTTEIETIVARGTPRTPAELRQQW